MTNTTTNAVAFSVDGTPIHPIALRLEYGLNRLPVARVEISADQLRGPVDVGTPCAMTVADTSWDLVVSDDEFLRGLHPSIATLYLVDPIHEIKPAATAAIPEADATLEKLTSRCGLRTVWDSPASFPALGSFGLSPASLLDAASTLSRMWFWRDHAAVRFASAPRGKARLQSGESCVAGNCSVVRCAFGTPPDPGASAEGTGYSGVVRAVRVTASHGTHEFEVTVGPPPARPRWREPATSAEVVTVASVNPALKVRLPDGDDIPARWVGRRLLGGRHTEDFPVKEGDQVLALLPCPGLTARPVIVLPYAPADAGVEYILQAIGVKMVVENAVKVEVGDAVHIQ